MPSAVRAGAPRVSGFLGTDGAPKALVGSWGRKLKGSAVGSKPAQDKLADMRQSWKIQVYLHQGGFKGVKLSIYSTCSCLSCVNHDWMRCFAGYPSDQLGAIGEPVTPGPTDLIL